MPPRARVWPWVLGPCVCCGRGLKAQGRVCPQSRAYVLFGAKLNGLISQLIIITGIWSTIVGRDSTSIERQVWNGIGVRDDVMLGISTNIFG